MGAYIEKWDRALGFLMDYGHDIGMTDGVSIVVDRKSYPIRELPTLAARLHNEEWVVSEITFLDNLLKPKSGAHED